MDIHKPKPWRGFREFLKEYLIIVVGVLTALAAEQGVEWLHWRHEARVAREALAFDLKRVIGESSAKDAESACVAARLGEIGEALDQAQVTHRLPPLGWTSEPLNNGWNLRSWSGLLSGQALSHIPNREQLLLAGMEGYLEYLRNFRTAEPQEWAILRGTAGPGRPTSDAEIAVFRGALERAYQDATKQKQLGQGLETMVVKSGFLSRREIDSAFKEGTALGRGSRVCGPASPAPARARDVLERPLLAPVTQPGEGGAAVIGNSGAVSTER